MTQEQLNEQLKDYCDKYSSFRYNDFHFPTGWSEEQMDVYRESRMEEYLSGIKELIQLEEHGIAYEEGKRYGHDLGINYANQIPDEETENRIRNVVLSEVERELPEIEKRKENVLFSSNIQDHLDDAIIAGKERYKHQVSTIINNLKVK